MMLILMQNYQGKKIKNAIEGLQNELMFKNPAIDPANSKIYF